MGLSPTGKAPPYHGARAIADSLTRQPPPTAFEIGTHRFGLVIMRLTILLVLFVLLINAFMLLPFLPMLTTQIVLNNILCNFSLCHGDRRNLAIYLFGGVFRLRSASCPVYAILAAIVVIYLLMVEVARRGFYRWYRKPN